MRLALELAGESAILGEPFSGRIRVLEGGETRGLSLTASLTEKTAQLSAKAHSETHALPSGESLQAGDALEFSLTIPPELPPSYKGQHSELYWELTVDSDEPGFDTRITRRIEILAP